MALRLVIEGKSNVSTNATQLGARLADPLARRGSSVRPQSAALALEPDPADRANTLVPTSRIECARRRAKRRSRPRNARNALHEMLARIDVRYSETGDTTRLIRAWRRLVRGRWSLVETFE